MQLFPHDGRYTFSVGLCDHLARISNAYCLKIRDIDQLVNKFRSCLRAAVSAQKSSGIAQIICVPSLIIGLVEQDRSFESFGMRRNDRSAHFEPVDKHLLYSPDITMDTFIRLMMDCVVKHKVFAINGDEVVRVPTRTDLKNEYAVSDNYYEMLSLIASLGNFTQKCSASRDHKYWMWSDYKKVIELAGNLE